jgi:hypothetical protein
MKNDSRTELKNEIAVLESLLREKKEQLKVLEEIERQKDELWKKHVAENLPEAIDLS